MTCNVLDKNRKGNIFSFNRLDFGIYAADLAGAPLSGLLSQEIQKI